MSNGKAAAVLVPEHRWRQAGDSADATGCVGWQPWCVALWCHTPCVRYLCFPLFRLYLYVWASPRCFGRQVVSHHELHPCTKLLQNHVTHGQLRVTRLGHEGLHVSCPHGCNWGGVAAWEFDQVVFAGTVLSELMSSICGDAPCRGAGVWRGSGAGSVMIQCFVSECN